ncbi:MAG: glycosyltransferase family 39 protein [Chloroflexi bacterium]|nr:glycosyltransferase family 39 protein [Chloroflexota bacterium]
MGIVTAEPALAPVSAPELVRSRRARTPARWQLGLLGLAIFLVALAPRWIGVEQHLTADDQDWMRRVSRFSQAVRRGDLRGTYQTSHPGLPVLWLTSLAIGPERSAALAARAGSLATLEKTPSYLSALFDARRALALASAVLTVLLAFLTWRVFGPGPGLLAGLLLAVEPFLVAHGKLFHTDPLLAQLMAASGLAALVFFGGRGGLAYLLGSGLAAGLALLTKAPGIFLFGFVPLLGLAWAWRRAWPPQPPRIWGGWGGHADIEATVSVTRRLAFRLGLWGLAAGAIYVLLFPAMWVDPLGTLSRMARAVLGEGETPRTWGNFFLGQATWGDVGPLFYPVATLLRLSPITLAGLLLLAWLGLRGRPASWRLPAVALVAYVGLFTLMMTLSPKKIDRYLLPVYLPLLILGALGLWLALRRWLAPGARWAVVAALGLGQAALVVGVHPYPLSFYNPVLGGIGVASRALVVGWGEGTDQVAAYLDRQPNAADLVVSSLYHDLLHAQFRGRGVPLSDWQRADYLADYVNMDQRGLVPIPLQELVRTAAPVFTARINGLDYVRLYEIPAELKAAGGPSGAPRKALPPQR